ncbi:hypothetical protein ABZ519_19485 [Streptomyces collinus]|uniref:hypothetical protein n=1 Tax=Streptomyces collinus TaxID=42684 RepID=UPI0033D04586
MTTRPTALARYATSGPAGRHRDAPPGQVQGGQAAEERRERAEAAYLVDERGGVGEVAAAQPFA